MCFLRDREDEGTVVAPNLKGRDGGRTAGRRRSSLFQALAKVAPVMPPLVGGRGTSSRSRRSSTSKMKSLSGYKGSSLGSRRLSRAESGSKGEGQGGSGDDANSTCRASDDATGLGSTEGGANKTCTPSERLKGRTLTPFE